MTQEQLIKALERPLGPVDAVLDTDTYNEIDDQFALAYMLKSSEKINVKAFFAAPFFNGHSTSPEDGMERSYNEILNLLELMDRSDLAGLVYKGSRTYLPDENTPVPSEAADRLIELAKGYSPEKPLYVVAIGAITNVASALIKAPEIKDSIVVVWLGGNAHHFPSNGEFNCTQDIAAARVVFGCGAPVVQFPCAGVVNAFTISEAELLMWLKGKNRLCDYLVQHTIDEVSYAKGKPWTRVIWDVTAVSWLTGDFCESYLTPSVINEYDDRISFDPRRHFMRYVYHIKRDELVCDLFEKLTR